MQSKWLLNLAYMTLGKYPNEVPNKHLISEKLLQSNVSFPKFTNIAASLGLDVMDNSGGGSMEDFLKDGALNEIVAAIMKAKEHND